MAPSPATIEHRVPGAWLARILGRLTGLYLRLVAATVRTSGQPLPQHQVVFVLWHQDNLSAATAAVKMRIDTRLASFSTRGFRGIMMNTLLETMRARAITLPDEGRETRGEAGRVAREMASLAADGFSLVVSCDGPFGPYRVAKPGALLVGRESGLPLYPIAVGFRPAWRLRSRWDRHLVPLPFAVMRIEHGTPLTLGPREPVKPLLPVLQGELSRVAERADAWMSRRR